MFIKSQVNHKTHTHGHNTDIHATTGTVKILIKVFIFSLKSILSQIHAEFFFLRTSSLLPENSFGLYVADNITYLLTFLGNKGTFNT